MPSLRSDPLQPTAVRFDLRHKAKLGGVAVAVNVDEEDMLKQAGIAEE